MSYRIEKLKDELFDFYAEVVVENGPRYRNPKEWAHLWVDFWNALFEHLHYTLGHIVAVGLPLWGILELINLMRN